MLLAQHIECWQPTVDDHAALVHAQCLYESTLDADERIPWVWIERSVFEREPAANGWCKHLILARVNDDLAGLVYGAFLPGFGGYLCYVTIDERYRKLGLATRLYDAFESAIREDALAAGEQLPFLLWESYRPEADDNDAAFKLWQARTRLFERVGGLWVRGLVLQTPNFDGSGAPTVPMQVFIKPIDEPAETFDDLRLQDVTAELLQRVYGQDLGDKLWDATFDTDVLFQLTSPLEASGV